MRTEIAILEFPVSLFTDLDKPAEVIIGVSKVEPTALPADVRARVGNNAVFDFNLSVGGKNITEFGANHVRITFPYSLKDGEKPGQVVIYYIADNGSLEVIKNGRYNSKTGMMEFKAKHFSKYAAVPVTVSFADLHQASWAADSIAALAARSIVKGASVESFLPKKDVTRAEYVQMLVQTLDLQADGTGESFSDVKADAWYESSIITAQAFAIINGKEDGTFGVNEKISRQDMAVMTYRALEAAGVTLELSNGDERFADESAISSYAREAVTAMQKAGIINGMPSGEYAPYESANRAQAAVILYRILNQI
ncbi:Endo-1,4-beta-xylanase A precursor [compost metagenome]